MQLHYMAILDQENFSYYARLFLFWFNGLWLEK